MPNSDPNLSFREITELSDLVITGELSLQEIGRIVTSTESTNARVVITSTGRDAVRFYSGLVAETAPGKIWGSSTAGHPILRLTSPTSSTGTVAESEITMRCGTTRGVVEIAGHCYPAVSGVQNLGSSTAQWHDLWVSGDITLTSDALIPKAPTNLAATADTYINPRGLEQAYIVPTWTDPTQNTDNSALTDLDMIIIRYRVNGTEDEWEYAEVDHAASGAFRISRLDTSTIYELQVQARRYNGNVSAWTASVTVDTSVDSTAPSTPAAPTMVGTGQRGLRVTHTLKNSGGTVNLEADLDHLLVYLDTAAEVAVDAAHLAGEIHATQAAIAAGNGAHGHFNSYGTTKTVRGTVYYCKVAPVDLAGNVGTASAASAGVTAGAETGDAMGTPPTPTVTAIRSGVRVLLDFSAYGPDHLDTVTIHYFGGSAGSPTDEIGEKHVSREAMAAGRTIRKDLAVAFGTTSTFYVRVKLENSAGSLSDYSADGSAAIAAIPGGEISAGSILTAAIGAEQITGPLIGDGSVVANLVLSSGGAFRTASTGQRIEITAANKDFIRFYSGSSDESAPAYVGAGGTTGPFLNIKGPATTGVQPPLFTIYPARMDFKVPGNLSNTLVAVTTDGLALRFGGALRTVTVTTDGFLRAT